MTHCCINYFFNYIIHLYIKQQHAIQIDFSNQNKSFQNDWLKNCCLVFISIFVHSTAVHLTCTKELWVKWLHIHRVIFTYRANVESVSASGVKVEEKDTEFIYYVYQMTNSRPRSLPFIHLT